MENHWKTTENQRGTFGRPKEIEWKAHGIARKSLGILKNIQRDIKGETNGKPWGHHNKSRGSHWETIVKSKEKRMESIWNFKEIQKEFEENQTENQ